MKLLIRSFPLVLGLSLNFSTFAAPSIPNPSFEADHYTVSPGYASGNGGAITGWTISSPGSTGLNINGMINPGLFADNGLIPDGTNVAFIQSSGTTNTLSTTIASLVAGTTYQVAFRANSRSSFGLGPPHASWSSNGGANLAFTCYPPVGAGRPYYFNRATFTATGPTAALALRNDSAGDTTVLLDNFSVNPLVVVTTINDTGPGSLRNAVTNALDGALITFAPALAGQTITLTSGYIAAATNLTIDGSGLAGGIQINGNASSRIFSINSGVTVALNSLIITNGNSADYGGGLFNQGALTLNRCTFRGNQSLGTGFGGGGAILNDSSATLTVNQCTFTGNNAYGGGGAIWNNGTGMLYVNNSTFTGNSGGHAGGAVQKSFTGSATINNSTITGNSAANVGGGIYNYTSGSLYLTNSVVCGNSLDDIYGPITAGSHNLVHVAAQLAPLGNYGGSTQTMPPLPGSPAIAAGTPTALGSDQRDYPRTAGLAVDIGAVQGIYVAAGPGKLTGPTVAGGSFRFSFTNLTDASFAVLATTNLGQPPGAWTQAGFTTETPAGSGHFQFIDPQAAGYFAQRFYRLSSP